MPDIKWYDISDLYTIKNYKITHRKDPVTKWIRLPCVYKIKINNAIVEVGRSDTCKKPVSYTHLQKARRRRKSKESNRKSFECSGTQQKCYKNQKMGTNQVATQTK